ncbi:MAG: anti-sigma factor [Chloroflexi bacterium AL-W]|nr:anti-sigma factor [Chloroflexi bacterium AL-N1]NOK67027.1 anti-sigma factor [Chloroflexi bacterium AL-N10]NOK74681.1 anti-sigma factor [Chloroflexi bacterium AL-N5]NOK81629.1 anti-sigma factor [Chloroflexi bacterium AL-W]NOK89099.1 anti-sigma factor [Chloroflexi bacterium AL-N15]
MMQCCDEGMLRAYIDGELSVQERECVATELASCATCQQRYHELRAQRDRMSALLSPDSLPHPQLMLVRIQDEQRTSSLASLETHPSQFIDTEPQTNLLRSNVMNLFTRLGSGRRGVFAGLATIILVLGLFAFPPVRAAADQLLQVFRVQSVVFVPIDPDRMAELENLNFDEEMLFIAEPEVINEPEEPQQVETLEAATDAAGFTAVEPTDLPSSPTETELFVTDESSYQFQVDVEAARQLLTLTGVTDIELPDALGAEPIKADVAPAVMSRYTGDDYEISLVQGTSPDVTLPDGVDLAELGKAALRLLGMEASQAEALSERIDWSTTLVFPIPANIDDVRQVTIDGAEGLLIGQQEYGNWSLYWQDGERFYVMNFDGNFDELDVISIAESVR